MDKEMMAKVNDFMKANGRRELSMDELDQVVGGSFQYDHSTGMCVVNGGAPVTAEAFTDMIFALASNFGFGIALDTLRDITGWNCTDALAGNYSDGIETGEEAMKKMAVIMTKFLACL